MRPHAIVRSIPEGLPTDPIGCGRTGRIYVEHYPVANEHSAVPAFDRRERFTGPLPALRNPDDVVPIVLRIIPVCVVADQQRHVLLARRR